MFFARKTKTPAETTGHDLAQQHSAIVEYQASERAELFRRHTAERDALRADLDARESAVITRLDELDAEFATILETKEKLSS